MNSNMIARGIVKAFAIILGIALLLYFLYLIRSVISYILIAAVLSLVGRPIVLFLRRRLKFSNTIAVITTMVLFIAILAGLVSLFIPLVAEQSRNLSLLNINELQNNIEDLYTEIVNYFNLNRIDIEREIKDSGFFQNLDYSLIPDFLNSLVSGLGSFSVGLFSVLFIGFFFLKDSKLFEDGILTFVPDTNELRVKKSINKIKDMLSRYFVALIIQILILFIIYTVVLLIFGIKNAIVIAFLCALLNLIPYIGPLVSFFLMMLLTMSSNLGESFSEVILPTTIYVLIGFIIAQLVDNLFSQPFIYSRSARSHPLEIFLVIVIAGLTLGVIGMIVAIPTYTALKVILKEFLSENKIVQRITKDL
ncbi:MAG: AI-2E family transporter [Bacteroidia bacterium]|nr:AI-2E family transporter [Bacteroidia bacterium]NNK74254.1 AI-2E family transporter [Flavobacteriaceae bacterium]